MTYSNENLPKKRIGATAIFTNEVGAVLVVKPAYRSGWLTPGGTVDEGESPLEGCEREVSEELGHDFPVGRLLCLEYIPAHDDKVENIQFVFEGCHLDSDLAAHIKLPESELVEYRFVGPAQLGDYLNGRLTRRVHAALEAGRDGSVVYLEAGTRISKGLVPQDLERD